MNRPSWPFVPETVVMLRPSSVRPLNGRCRALGRPALLAVAMTAALASPAFAAPLAPPIQAMIETAFAGSDDAVIAAVLSVAKKTAPDSLAEIDALEANYRGHRAAAKAAQLKADRARLGSASWLALWTGELEVGGVKSTGSSDDTELHLSAKIERNGLHWVQKLDVQADYGADLHAVTTDRIDTTYQSQFKLGGSGYTYGLAEYERDRFLGYQDRYTAGLGFGFAPIDTPDFKLRLDAGPAVRYTLYDERTNESALAARGSIAVSWTARPGVTLSEDGAVYIDRSHSTARSTVSLNTDLFGPLKARLSYNVQFERREPETSDKLDTTTRATLVYGF
jgi:putative salt-induced outer membrane protein